MESILYVKLLPITLVHVRKEREGKEGGEGGVWKNLRGEKE